MNIALIGTGAMARRFLAAVREEIEGVRFIAAHSRQAERLEQFQREYPRIECTTDLAALLGREDIQAVYISTPVSTHAPLSIAAARAGKHILCEKPMALTVSDCEAMIEAAEEGGVVLQIGYMMRFHPAHQLIKKQVDSGDLGTLRFVHLERTTFIDFLSADMPEHRKWFIRPEDSGGGALMDLGSHLIDLLLYLPWPASAFGAVCWPPCSPAGRSPCTTTLSRCTETRPVSSPGVPSDPIPTEPWN